MDLEWWIGVGWVKSGVGDYDLMSPASFLLWLGRIAAWWRLKFYENIVARVHYGQIVWRDRKRRVVFLDVCCLGKITKGIL